MSATFWPVRCSSAYRCSIRRADTRRLRHRLRRQREPPHAFARNGGPGTGTTATVAFNVLQTGIVADREGYASAMAIVMLVIVAVASAVALRVLQRREVDL